MSTNLIGVREDTYRLTMNLDGSPTGAWAEQEGGDIDSEESIYHPGGMERPQSRGGRVNYGSVTLRREYDHDLYRRLSGRVGKGRVEAYKQPLDIDGNAYGASAIAFVGTLKKISSGSVKASGSDTAWLEVEITVESQSVS